MRVKKLLSLFLAALMALSSLSVMPSAAEGDDTLSILGLKTEDLTNPVGIDAAAPRFSWYMESEVTGQCQTAYKVEVSTGAQFSSLVWDSGKVTSSDSVGITYSGTTLLSSTVYFWRVTVWDKDDTAHVSQTATFETGLLEKNAWDASQWIQVGTPDFGTASSAGGAVNYEVEAKLTAVKTAATVIFNVRDANSFYMWQVRIDGNSVIIKPHVKVNGGYPVIISADITHLFSGGTSGFLNRELTLKVKVTDDGITTYVNGEQVHTMGVSDLPADFLPSNEYLGKVGFRCDANNGEEFLIDDLKVTDYSSGAQSSICSYDFNLTNPFSDGELSSGKLRVTTEPGASEMISFAIPAPSYTAHYVIEADLSCQESEVGLIFNGIDNNTFYMWQINLDAVATPGVSVALRPHVWNKGAISSIKDVDITHAVDRQTVMTSGVHMKIEVTESEIKTWINGTLVDTLGTSQMSIPSYAGRLGVRSYNTSSGMLQAVKMTDYNNNPRGEVVYDYDFEDTNPFFAGKIEDGAFVVSGAGELLTPAGTSVFRKEFTPAKQVKGAKLYVTGLGVFDAYLNGQRVGHKQPDGTYVYDELKPGFTETLERVFYYSYDVTELVKSGANAISAIVTPGWWSGSVNSSATVNGKKGENTAFRAQLVLTYADNSTEVIGTDNTWKAIKGGPVLSAGIFDGEIYDGTVSTAWKEVGYDDSAWTTPQKNTEFDGVICAHVGPTVRVRSDLERTPTDVTIYDGVTGASDTAFGQINVTAVLDGTESFTLKKGETAIFDMGQNFAGWPEIKVSGARGTVVAIRHAEMLNTQNSGTINANGIDGRGNDGPEGSVYLKNLRTDGMAQARYILSGEGVETYHSTFTYYGFRYVEVSATDDITIHGMRGLVLTSVQEETGSIVTANADVNQLFSNIKWGQYSNYLSIPTDCPQRNERQGWTADTQIFSITAAYNADSKGFLRKWLQDLRDAQYKDGEVPADKAGASPVLYAGAYPDTAPRSAWHDPGSAAWGDAGIIVPYNLYMMYGDVQVVEESYDSMTAYMDWVAAQNQHGPNVTWGDHLSYEGSVEVNQMIAVVYYANDALMMEKMARALGKDADANKYHAVYQEQKAYFNATYMNADGTVKHPTQTGCLMALMIEDMISPEAREKVKEQLLKNISSKGNRLQTGFVGTGELMQTLTEIGAADTAYTLLLQRNNPSWLYSIDQGATTTWERWNSYTEETGFGDAGMNSFNHYAYGVVAQWMYSHMAGIMYDEENPGFKHFILNPSPGEVIGKAQASYRSAYGLIESGWEYKTVGEDTVFVYDAKVPANTTATIYVPIDGELLVNGKAYDTLTADDGITYVATQDGKAQFEAVSGTYHFGPVEDTKAPVDIDTHWAKDILYDMSRRGIMQGVVQADGTVKFLPDNKASRAEFSALVVRVLGLLPVQKDIFTDVTSTAWYYSDVAAVYEYGAIKGVTDTTFEPDRPISRQEVAVILYRIAQAEQIEIPAVDTAAIAFTDNEKIADWARESVAFAVSCGLVVGYAEDGTFRPENQITRAEIATVLSRLMKLL